MFPNTEIFQYFEMTPDLVCIAGKDGYFRNVNKSVIQTLGYTTEELMAQPIASFIHPDDKELTARRRKELLEGKTLVNFDNRYLTKDGQCVWLHWSSIYLPEREVVFAIAKNINERKVAEEQLTEKYSQFRKLATHFKTSMESDKKTLASELHEQVAQLAWVIKSNLNWLKENVAATNSQAGDRIEHATSATELLIESIRNMSYTIGTGILEDMGLNEALRWLAHEFAKQNDIVCEFESRYDDDRLSREVQLDLYRICQESLNNIATHAEATSVSIDLGAHNENLVLTITDDGRGFEPENISYKRGLTNMKSRAASLNGKVTVHSSEGKGTSISIIVALPIHA